MSQYVRAKQAHLREQSQRYSQVLQRIPREEWPPLRMRRPPVEVWRSQAFLVQVYIEHGHTRLSVCRTAVLSTGRWQDGITWDDLQRLKAECGHGEQWAVEVFPPDAELVNDANMRHLWLLPEAPPYGWRVEP